MTKPANLPIFSICQCSKSAWRSQLFLEHALLERVQYPYLYRILDITEQIHMFSDTDVQRSSGRSYTLLFVSEHYVLS